LILSQLAFTPAGSARRTNVAQRNSWLRHAKPGRRPAKLLPVSSADYVKCVMNAMKSLCSITNIGQDALRLLSERRRSFTGTSTVSVTGENEALATTTWSHGHTA